MENIVSENEEELIGILRSTDIRVHSERKSRNDFEEERWILFRFLATYLKYHKFYYPVSICKMESPDFLILENNRKTGVEVTEAINPNYLKATSLPEAKDNESSVDVGHFKWNTNHSLSKLRDIASRGKLTSSPWEGNSVEIEFGRIVHDVTNKKTKILNKSGFKKYDNNSLLIYVNQTLPILDIEEGTEISHSNLVSYWGDSMFTYDHIYVEVNDLIICFCSDGYEIYETNDLWK